MSRKVTFTVVCSYNAEHTFPVVFEIEQDSNVETEQTLFCPFCGKDTTVTIQGKVMETEIHRLFRK